MAIGILTCGAAPGAAAAVPAADPGPFAAAADREGPRFYSGLLIDVSGVVDGDVYASGQTITISGDVTGDVIAAAQSITVTGTVDGDVRLAGQDVTISGEVSRSATVFAATLTVADEGVLGRDLVGAAGSVSIAGEIGRDVLLGVDRLSIDGAVSGDVTYYSENDARLAAGAVDGTVQRIEPPRTPRIEVSPWSVLFGWLLGFLYALVALSIVTLVAGLVLPLWLQRVTDHLMPTPWRALLVGFVASIAVPFALLFLLVTVVGAPLALAGLLVWAVLTLATFVYGAFYIGRLLFRDRPHPVVEALVGGLILIAALQIPWLNVLVWLAMVFFGLGAQLLEFQRQRPWRAQEEPAPVPEAQASTVAPPAEPSPREPDIG